MNYIKRHWKGELSLAISFWINGALLNFMILGIEQFMASSAFLIQHPVAASIVSLLYTAIALLIIYPWQIVGMWRSAERKVKASEQRFLPRLVQVLVVIGIFSTFARVAEFWATYQDIWDVAFNDPYSGYQVHWREDASFIHIEGMIGFGLSDRVEDLIDAHPSVKGIVLDSVGGRLYEGRALAALIEEHQLDTYTMTQCYSACTIAYVAGESRILAEGANLGFHQYSNSIRGMETYVDDVDEEKIDSKYFEHRGVSREFIDQMHGTASDDMWYPSTELLIDAGVVHKILPPSEVLKTNSYLTAEDWHRAFDDLPAMATVQKFDPDMYSRMRIELETQAKNGATMLQMQQKIGQHFFGFAMQALPKTSDQALIGFIEEMIDVLKMLNEKEPFVCIKYIFPDQFGPLEITKFLTTDQMTPMLDSLNQVLIDSYTNPVLSYDIERASVILDKVFLELEDQLDALDVSALKNRDDYARSCNLVIELYQRVLDLGGVDAEIGSRHLMSQ